MPLTDWIEWDRELVDSLYEKPNIDLKGHNILVKPLSKSYSTIGTSFDYLLRLLMLQENHLTLNDYFPIAAEHAPLNKKRFLFIDSFRSKVQEYLNNHIDINEFITDVVPLARIESIYRSGGERPDDEIFSIEQEKITELQNLLNITDTKLFHANKHCLLNPSFGQSSTDVCGADADIIIDNVLIEIKTTQNLEMRRQYVRQLVGYYILNLREREHYLELDAPCINELGVYFSRYGMLVKFPIPNFTWYDIMSDINASFREYQEFYFPQSYLDKLDDKCIKYQNKQYFDKLWGLCTSIFNSVGHKFDICSPEQVKTVLFEELALPKPNDGKIFTALKTLSSTHPVIKLLRECYALQKGIPKLDKVFAN